jgi:hypothetical protein
VVYTGACKRIIFDFFRKLVLGDHCSAQSSNVEQDMFARFASQSQLRLRPTWRNAGALQSLGLEEPQRPHRDEVSWWGIVMRYRDEVSWWGIVMRYRDGIVMVSWWYRDGIVMVS